MLLTTGQAAKSTSEEEMFLGGRGTVLSVAWKYDATNACLSLN